MPDFSPTLALLRLARPAEIALARALDGHGLTLRKLELLRDVAEVPGIPLGELARRARMAAVDLRAPIRTLVEAGLIRPDRGGSPIEGPFTATERGARVADAVERDLRALDATFFTGDLAELPAALADATPGVRGEPQD